MLRNLKLLQTNNTLCANALKTTITLHAQFHIHKARTLKKKLIKGAAMPRYWEFLQLQESEKPQQCYKLLSYNILAQDLLMDHPYLYKDIDPQLLRWEHRLRLLRAEIDAMAPDILCLQEMQYNHIKHLVKLIRGDRRLEYVYKKKTGYRSDGCAIIYDKHKLKLLEDCGLEYYTKGQSTLNRENIAVLAKFCPRDEPAKQFIVATTHLLYNPRRDDVRAAQAEKLLDALNTFSVRDSCSPENEPRLPVLLTGDFNCVRDSMPYEALHRASKPAAPSRTQDESQASSYLKQSAPSTEDSASALQMEALNFGRNGASTLQGHWKTVDYILCSIGEQRDRIKVWSVYKLPTVQDCEAMGKIPNWHFGSDHYSLAIVFSM